MLYHAGPSLRTKRFRLVSEQKETVEGEFRFWSREKFKREPKNERGGKGRGRKETRFLPFFPTPFPLFYLRHFSRGLWLLFLVLCSFNRTETPATQATLGPAHEFSLQDVKLSRIVIYRYNIIRIKCSFNWSCINYGEIHCDSVDSSLVFFYKCEPSDWSAYSLPWQ